VTTIEAARPRIRHHFRRLIDSPQWLRRASGASIADVLASRWRHVVCGDIRGRQSCEGASVAYVSRVLGHANPAITLSIYAHEFARAEHADRPRERMEQAFGDLLG